MKKTKARAIECKTTYISFAVVSYFIILAVPLLLGQFRWFTGITVNTIFILAALNFRNNSYIPMIFLPSIEKIFGALILGIFFYYLLYIIPFIWIGNGLYISLFRYFKNNIKMHSLASIVLSSLIKTAVIFVPTFILYMFDLVPYLFMIAMGAMQFATAITGGVLALLINQTKFFQNLKKCEFRK